MTGRALGVTGCYWEGPVDYWEALGVTGRHWEGCYWSPPGCDIIAQAPSAAIAVRQRTQLRPPRRGSSPSRYQYGPVQTSMDQYTEQPPPPGQGGAAHGAGPESGGGRAAAPSSSQCDPVAVAGSCLGHRGGGWGPGSDITGMMMSW